MTTLQSISHQEQVSAARRDFLEYWAGYIIRHPKENNYKVMQQLWDLWLDARVRKLTIN